MNKKIKYKKMSNKSGRNFCDELWAILVKQRDNNQCIVCEAQNMVNAHHLITRKVFKYRWDVNNGITLCPKHHEFDVTFSAHTAPWALEEWLKENNATLYSHWVENRNNITNEDINYEQIYLRLEKEYYDKNNSYYKFDRISQYLMFLNADKINESFNNNVDELSKLYQVSTQAMNKFLIANKIKIPTKKCPPKS